MHANRDLITGFLKDKLKFRVKQAPHLSKFSVENQLEAYLFSAAFFQGFVISDWEGIDKITSPPRANYSYSVQAGVLAGIDMVRQIAM